jgi:hypothetical protein
MTRETFVDTRVRAFTKYMNCDPELAQGLYFEHKVSSTLDNEQKASMRRELSALQNVSNNLDRAAKVLEGISTDDDQLRTALRIEGLNYLLKRILSCLLLYFAQMSRISRAFLVWPLSWLTEIPK